MRQTEKTSQKTFLYNNEEEIMEFQICLLNYLELLYSFYGQVNEFLQEIYFQCLKEIFDRGEF